MENPIIINVTCPPRNLWLGRESENNYRSQRIECAEWLEKYPGASIVAYYQPYATSDPYPLVLTADGTKRIWHPTATELVKGNGELQIVLMLGDVVGTSAIIPTRVDRSLISEADHPADEAPSWTVQVVQDVEEQADRAEEAASHYPKIVNGVWYVWSVQAEDFVSTGIEAQGEGGYSPTVTVTEIEGGHRVTITDTDGAHTFDVLDGQGGSGSSTVVVTLDLTTNPPTASMTASEIWEAVVAEERVVISAFGFEFPFISHNEVENTAVFSVVAYDSTLPLAAALVVGSNGEVVSASSELARLSDIPSLAAYRTASAQDTIDAAQDAAIAAKYTKPSGGIPKSDLASAVQTSLGKADTALQTAPVTSVNTKTGAVTLSASDVGALPSSTSIPTKVSDLQNDSGFQTAPFEIEVTQSGSTYSTTASAADILAHQDNCVAVLYGTKVSLSAVTGNEYMAELFFANLAVNEGAGYTMAQQIHISVNNGVVTVLADAMVLKATPSVPRVAMTSSDTTPTLNPNTFYVFPTMASLAPTLAAPSDNSIVNEYHFMFTSGAAATTLTLPASVLQPDGFTVEANHVCEVSIVENCMTAQGWAVTA